MEHKKRRRLVEALKDAAIVVLALTAIYLTFRTQMTTLSAQGGGWLGSLVQALQGGTGQLLGPDEPGEPRQVPVYPARIVVTGPGPEYPRYGMQYNNPGTDELFGGVFSVLGEALAAASEPYPVTEQTWRQALTGQTGIFFDFLGQYPLETLLSWLEQGGRNAALTGTARRLLLATDDGGNAVLYYHNAADGSYYACRTSGAVLSHLMAAVEGRGSNGLKYAFEYAEDAGAYENLAPYVLLDTRPPSLQVYRAENALSVPANKEEVWTLLASMEALGFQAQAGTPYQPGSREWVVNEGQDQLRISSGGTISFHTEETGTPRYRVIQAGEEPTATELLDAVQPIAAGTVGARCGDARLYLMGLVRLGDGSWQVDFGYSLNGAAVQLYGEGYAARFILRDGAVTEFSLHFRSYTASGETDTVLPELQAAAALGVLSPEPGELLLCYEDNGGETVRPGWIAQGTV